MTGQRLGSLIGAVFGLVYVLVNAGPLPSAIGWPLQVLGTIAFVVVLGTIRRGRGTDRDGSGQGGRFGRGYWVVVGGEAAALAIGLVVLNGPLDAPQAGVGWVSVVVGLHFLPLARLSRETFFCWLGIAIAGFGVVGLALAAAGATEAPIAAVSGVVPGALLLGVAWWGAHRSLERRPPRALPDA